jgi:hypothetical protein
MCLVIHSPPKDQSADASHHQHLELDDLSLWFATTDDRQSQSDKTSNPMLKLCSCVPVQMYPSQIPGIASQEASSISVQCNVFLVSLSSCSAPDWMQDYLNGFVRSRPDGFFSMHDVTSRQPFKISTSEEPSFEAITHCNTPICIGFFQGRLSESQVLREFFDNVSREHDSDRDS